jgi:hypothetical protein
MGAREGKGKSMLTAAMRHFADEKKQGIGEVCVGGGGSRGSWVGLVGTRGGQIGDLCGWVGGWVGLVTGDENTIHMKLGPTAGGQHDSCCRASPLRGWVGLGVGGLGSGVPRWVIVLSLNKQTRCLWGSGCWST